MSTNSLTPGTDLAECAQVIFRAFFGETPPETHYVADFRHALRPVDGGKVRPRYENVERPPTVDDVLAHLRGERGLLAVPVDTEGMCRFGKIDVDDYGLDPAALATRVRDIQLPLTCERSKSGGLHLAFYLPQPAPAAAVRGMLTEWAERIGHPRAEIFPKQEALEKGDKGNGINLPYFGGDAAENYSLGPDGQRAMLGLWVEGLKRIAEHPAMTAASLVPPYWEDGKRQALAKALAGFLLRHEVGDDTIEYLLETVIKRTGHRPEKMRSIADLKRALKSGKKVFGFPRLCRDEKGNPMMGDYAPVVLAWCLGLDPEGGTSRGDSEDSEQALASMNAKHAVVSWKGKAVVLTEGVDPITGRPTFDLSSFDDVTKLYLNRPLKIGKARTTVGAWWLRQPERRQYDGVAFAPGRDLEGSYNLWRGWGVQPQEGDCSLYLDMVRDVICSGDEALHQYIIAWMADAVQNPTDRPGVVLVFRGLQGTGKGTMAREFGQLFGTHFLHIHNAQHLVGRFNGHLRNTLLLFADEAFFAGDKQHEGVLKGLITEPTVAVEYKGKDVIDVPNYVRIIMASNKEWVVPAALDDRRFCVVDVSTDKKGDSAYFAAVAQQMREGGAAALMHYLLNFDLSTVDLRKIPDTAARREQQLRSMDPIPAFWHARLNNGAQLDTLDDWVEELATQELFDAYAQEAGVTGERRRSHQTAFGIELQRMCPGISKRTVSKGKSDHKRRVKVYYFPPLSECRKAFEKYAGREKINWDEATGRVRWKDYEDVEC